MVTDAEARYHQTSNSSTLAHAENLAAQHKSKCPYAEDATEASSQPSPAQLATMYAFRWEADPNKSTVKVKAPTSETSSHEIVVDKHDTCGSLTEHPVSCWTRGDQAAEETGHTWDYSGRDVEKLGPLNPPPSLNNLSRRRPQNSQKNSKKVNVGSPAAFSFNRMLAQGVVRDNSLKPKPTKIVNQKVILQTNMNFPALPSLQQPSIPSSLSTHPNPSNHSPNKIFDRKAAPGTQSTSTTNKMSSSKAKIDDLPDPTVNKMEKTKATTIGALAPHLRPKTMHSEDLADVHVKSSTTPRRRQNTNPTATASKTEIKSSMPPHIAAAWNKSALTKSKKDADNDQARPQNAPRATSLPPHLQSFVVLNPETSNVASGKVHQRATISEVLEQDTSSNMQVPQHNPSPAPSGKEPEVSSHDFLNLMATQHKEWAESPTVRTPTSKIQTKKTTLTESPVQPSLPLTPEAIVVREPDLIEDDEKVNAAVNIPQRVLTAGVNHAPKPEKSALVRHIHISRQTLGSNNASSSKKHNITSTKGDSWEFPWISGEQEQSLVGWNNKMKPPPIGDEWTSRDPHDPTGVKRQAVVKTWAEDQIPTPIIDVKNPKFLTGLGIVEEDTGLQHVIEASLHNAIPDRTTVNEPKRQLNTEDAIKDHIARHGMPQPEEAQQKGEKRDPITSMTKSERRANLEYWRAANRDVQLEPNEHTPKANIYMRPAELKDIPLITHLHNGFVANSVATHFVAASDEMLWRETLQSCIKDRCPFFVAILSLSQRRAMRAQDVRTGKFESVVGFAYGVDFGAPDNAFRVTLEIEIWVDPRYQHQGIGKTLLDRMLACLDPMYSWKDPAPFLDLGERDKWMGGGHRIVQTIIVSMLYSDDEKETFEWKKRWLMRSNFRVGGIVPFIGRKFRRMVNICQMYYTTGHDVSHIIH